jgi:hypothetical protein
MFERGHIAIEGWIPTRLSGVVMANPQEVTAVAAPSDVNLSVTACDEGCTFEACFPDREASYASAVVAAMRDVLLKHREREHRMTVTAGEARQSLAVALGAQESAISGAPVEFGGIQVVG